MGCLRLLWTCHTPMDAHWEIFNNQADFTGAERVSPADTILSYSAFKNHNDSFASSVLLATNHAPFAVIYRLFSSANHKIAEWFPIIQPAITFHSLLCTIKVSWQRFEAYSWQVIHHPKQLAASESLDRTVCPCYVLRKFLKLATDPFKNRLISDTWHVQHGSRAWTVRWFISMYTNRKSMRCCLNNQ